MWTLRKRFRFEAAHHLPAHDGKCRRVHGHSWVGEVEVAGGELHATGPQTGMVIDYGHLSLALGPLVENTLDHYDLNESTGLVNPTSEEIARYIYDRLKSVLPSVVAVTIRETCTAACRYAPWSERVNR